MRRILSFIILFCLISCSKNDSKENLPISTGNYNHVLITINDNLWQGNVGDSIRNYLAAYLDRIVPFEPLFSLEHITPNQFSGHNKLARNIIVFSDNHNEMIYNIEKNKFSNPQNYIVVLADSKENLITNFVSNVDSIIKAVHLTELEAFQNALNHEVLHKEDLISSPFNVNIQLPLSFKLVQKGKDFRWFKKDVASGSSSVLFYAVPTERIESNAINKSILNAILEAKDSVSGKYLHSIEEGSYMKTNEGFTPFNTNVDINGVSALEIKGIWDMEKSFMSGPYITYVFKDNTTNRYLFIEGLVYNPSMNKRDMLLELEAIIKTAKLKEY
ncbi:DUF4837 family protein [Myroides injenensis]|uniref:DUF4837 family protein n=1 Tax=Myroides injenensis TaxID=1183151 RepID=UPI0002898FC0|nr:DUF4837 family protein [Myroides injenensis]